MPVDSYRFLPRSLVPGYRDAQVEKGPTPWTPLAKQVTQARFALVTTAGVYVDGEQPPFDVEREKQEPTWGDPTYRAIPRDLPQSRVGTCHLHVNNRDIARDVNIVLPIHRFAELEAAGEIGSLAPTHYSFMGWQGLPPDTQEWEERYVPEVAGRMRDEGVDAVLITPT